MHVEEIKFRSDIAVNGLLVILLGILKKGNKHNLVYFCPRTRKGDLCENKFVWACLRNSISDVDCSMSVKNVFLNLTELPENILPSEY